MANFVAEFPIDTKQSVHDVIRLGCRWITGSPHSVFSKGSLDNLPRNGELSVSEGSEQVLLGHSNVQDGEIGGLRYERSEESLAWTTSIVSLNSNGKHLLRMEVICEALTTNARLPPPKKPYFIKQALAQLGGGDDGEIPVTDQPFKLSTGEEAIAASLILGTARNSLPIVYVSADFDDLHLLNPVELAQFVGGLAHVVVEPNRSFSYVVKRLTKSRNVFGGAVGVYWPNSEKRSKYFGEDRARSGRALAIEIAKDIRVALSNQRPRSKCTWAHLKEALAKSRYEQLKFEGSTELSKYIAAFDDENAAKQQVIEEHQREIARLTSELRRLDSFEQSIRGGLIKAGEELDLYDGEIRDVIIAALKDAVERVAHPNSRREHVLKDLLAANVPRGQAEVMSDRIKTALRDYRSMDSRTRAILSQLGFDLSEDGKHWKAVFAGDSRYTFTFPKTGSDHRGGLNMVRDVTNALF